MVGVLSSVHRGNPDLLHDMLQQGYEVIDQAQEPLKAMYHGDEPAQDFGELPSPEDVTLGPPIEKKVATIYDDERYAGLEHTLAISEQLQSENVALEKQMEDLLNWMLVNYKGTYPLPENMLSDIRLDAVTEDFRLDPKTAGFVGVSPDEETVINSVFLDTYDTLTQIEDALLVVQPTETGGVVLHVPPFIEEGEILREDMYAALETTLGGERLDRLLDATEESMSSSFLYFGAAAHTLVFELVHGADPGSPTLSIRDGWIFQDGPNRRTIQMTESAVTTLPEEYGPYRGLLPETMAAF